MSEPKVMLLERSSIHSKPGYYYRVTFESGETLWMGPYKDLERAKRSHRGCFCDLPVEFGHLPNSCEGER